MRRRRPSRPTIPPRKSTSTAVVDNLGTIQATGTGAQVDLANGNFDNEVGGLIEADNGGTITFDATLNGGPNTGTIEAGAGGTIVIDGFSGNGLFNGDDKATSAPSRPSAPAPRWSSPTPIIIGGYLGTSGGGEFETVSGTSTLMNVILTDGIFTTDAGTVLDLNGGGGGVAAYIDGTVTLRGSRHGRDGLHVLFDPRRPLRRHARQSKPRSRARAPSAPATLRCRAC